MANKRRKGLTGVVGVGRALEADERSLQEQEPQVPAPAKRQPRKKSQLPAYRGQARADGQPLRTLSITLPADVVVDADTFVLHRKQVASGYNRSALVEEALRAFLEAQAK